VATVTEAFAALDNGADVLKMFPAEQLGPQVVKAWRAVIARDIALLPVGGITPEAWRCSARPAPPASAWARHCTRRACRPWVRQRADAFVAAWKALG
jgi:2-dehydro-3-deoxyphosphogalactonate aldolase